MLSFRAFGALALTLLPMTVTAQQQTPAAKPAAASAANDVLPFKATETTLPNGLKVIIVPTGFPNIVSLQIPVQTGSRNEIEPGKTGFAHFFEHMMFRGTKAYPPEKYQAVLTKVGARQNAYTTDDYTNYHTTFSKEDLEEVLKIEADRFQHLDYPVEAFKTEARAVLGEYNKNSASPINKLFEVMGEKAYTTHTYKHTTMGFLEDIEDMPNQFEYSRTFFDRWYRPEYTTIIVAGDVTPGEVLPLVKKYWGGWKRGSYRAEIPQEPEPKGPVYVHHAWETPTLPWVLVGFHGPAFSSTDRRYSATDLLVDLYFGSTSDIYKRLVVQEQKVDQFFGYNPGNEDPGLIVIGARLKNPKDAAYVRDEVLRTVARARAELVPAQRLADAKSNARYGLARTFDNTETIAATLARFVRYDREYGTLNELFRTYLTVTAEDIKRAANTFFTDNRLVVATLSHEPLPAEISRQPSIMSLASPSNARPDAAALDVLVQKTALPQLNVKLLFTVGSAQDPKGKEGLAALSAAMLTEAGSRDMRIDEIRKAFFPMAASFAEQVDKEMTTFTGRIHRDNWERFADIAFPMLLEPGFREEDFARLKDAQLNALTQDLRSNNEEELGKERLQEVIFRGTPYAHPVLGTVEGIERITLDDVKQFVRDNYTRANLSVGVAGDAPDALLQRLRAELAKLPAGTPVRKPEIAVARTPGMRVHIIKKDTRATAISFGHPIEVTRSHPDYAALYLARTWLGEHRSSVSHLYQQIRETRGMNYGDYAYIEAFPRGMFQFFPDPNIARRQQIFEVWIRPVVPKNAHMALRIAVHELTKLVENGMTQEAFEATRNYLMKNVFVMTATQDQQIGYALDSEWYGIPEYTTYMREQLAKLTLEDVNRAVRRHLSPTDLDVVIITKDAEALRDALVSDAFSPITYDAPKPAELLEEDKQIGALKLGIAAENVVITPVEEVFRR